eukprot:TRINITY_DN5140_c0_g1_i2.p1 TRINITY_DN5140_c0_g1~~TRINITY_DN5140_c0_g1_i2.p1  ORF type:complete len:455 (-),score=81.53 TRINITY_DN5140_c0_g1_i2:134-1498(-)
MVRKKTLEPVWNEQLTISLEDPLHSTLIFLFYDKDKITSDDYQGQVIIPISNAVQSMAHIQKQFTYDIDMGGGSFTLEWVNFRAISDIDNLDTTVKLLCQVYDNDLFDEVFVNNKFNMEYCEKYMVLYDMLGQGCSDLIEKYFQNYKDEYVANIIMLPPFLMTRYIEEQREDLNHNLKQFLDFGGIIPVMPGVQYSNKIVNTYPILSIPYILQNQSFSTEEYKKLLIVAQYDRSYGYIARSTGDYHYDTPMKLFYYSKFVDIMRSPYPFNNALRDSIMTGVVPPQCVTDGVFEHFAVVFGNDGSNIIKVASLSQKLVIRLIRYLSCTEGTLREIYVGESVGEPPNVLYWEYIKGLMEHLEPDIYGEIFTKHVVVDMFYKMVYARKCIDDQYTLCEADIDKQWINIFETEGSPFTRFSPCVYFSYIYDRLEQINWDEVELEVTDIPQWKAYSWIE